MSPHGMPVYATRSPAQKALHGAWLAVALQLWHPCFAPQSLATRSGLPQNSRHSLLHPRVPLRQRVGCHAAASTPPLSSELLAEIRAGAAAMDGNDAWQESAKILADAMAVELQEAEEVLAKAYGWKAWVQLNKADYIKREVPDPQLLKSSMQWLIEGPLKLDPASIRDRLERSPKIYLSTPADCYRQALQVAPEDFQDPDDFRDLLQQHPEALGLTWNCELSDPAERGLDAWGERIHCDGKCTNCWRTATPRLRGGVLDGVEV
mmetsp:Transcript_25277/g.46283  ORF Transcript_25277/g.46283 Transcript_25277/m.46283 type:complete len:264 (+) Transcript_25277:81-872(+)